MKGNYQKVKDLNAPKKFPNPKDTVQYEKPIGPERPPTTSQRIVSGITSGAQRVGGFLQDRASAIAHESQDVRPRRQKYRGSLPQVHQDPFGMAAMGNPFNPPQSEPAPRPRRRRRKKQQPAPRRNPPVRSGGIQMFGIPKHMRHMF